MSILLCETHDFPQGRAGLFISVLLMKKRLRLRTIPLNVWQSWDLSPSILTLGLKGKSRLFAWSNHLVPACMLSCFSLVPLFVTAWTIAHQAPPSMGFFRQEYWSGLLFPSAVDLPERGIEPGSPALQTYSLPSEPPGKSHLVPPLDFSFFGLLFFPL